MDQHIFVESCQRFYLENGLEPGNPDDGDWEDAHYPLPQPEGTETRLLLHNHHLVQGLWQSEEVGRCCFFRGHVKKFLTSGPFVENWFELWDLYEKWVSIQSKLVAAATHVNKDENGKSVLAVKMGKASTSKKDENGKSVNAVKAGRASMIEKDENGKSVHGVKMTRAAHAKKDENGKSVHGVKMTRAAHAKKDDQGRSLTALNASAHVHDEKDEQGRSIVYVKGLLQKWECLECGFITTPGALAGHQKGTRHTGRAKVEEDE